MIAPAPYTVELLVEPVEQAHPGRMELTLIDFERQGIVEAGRCDLSISGRVAALANGRTLTLDDFIERLRQGEAVPEEHGVVFGRALLGWLLAEPPILRAWNEISTRRLSAGRAMRLLLSVRARQSRGARPAEGERTDALLSRARALPFELLADDFGFLFRNRGHLLMRVEQAAQPVEEAVDDGAPQTWRVGSEIEPVQSSLRAHRSGLSRAFPWTGSLRGLPRREREFPLLEDAVREWTEQVSSVPAGPDAAPIPKHILGFVGRDEDVQHTLRALSEHRLVTITGVSGIGKTSLAIELARRLAQLVSEAASPPKSPLHPQLESVLWFSLEGIGAVDALRARMALALGLDPHRCRHDEDLALVIGSVPTLIVLDGADGFIENPLTRTRFQWLMNTLLDRCAELRFLVTSAERIGDVSVPGGDIPLALEMPVPLGPLRAPFDAELLTIALGTRLDDAEKQSVAGSLASLAAFYLGHPRALCAAAALIDAPSDVEALLGYVDGEAQRGQAPWHLLGVRPGEPSTAEDELRVLRAWTTLKLSMSGLLEEEPRAAEMLAWLALLPAGLPELFLPYLFGPDAGPTLAVLLRRGFVERREDDRHLRPCLPLPALPLLEGNMASLLPKERRTQLLSSTFSVLSAWLTASFQHPGTWRDRDRAVQQAENMAALVLEIPEPPPSEAPLEDVPLSKAIAGALVPFAQGMMRAGFARFASNICREAVKRVSMLGGAAPLAALLTALGDLLARIDQLEEAESVYRHALPIYSALRDHLSMAGTLLSMGDIYSRMGKIAKAQECLEQSLAYFRALHERHGEAHSLRALGDLFMRSDRLQEAEGAYRDALPVFEALGEPLGEASVRQSYGDLLLRHDRLPEAETQLSKALPLYRAMDEGLGEANTLQALGDLYTRTGRLKDAEEAYQRALVLYQHHDAPLGEANCLRALGETWILDEKHTEADASLRQALTLYRALRDKQGWANTLQSMGKLLLQQQEGEAAYERFLAAHKLHSEIGDRLGMGGDRGYLARAARMAGQHLRAVVMGKAALDAMDRASDRYAYYVAMRDLARSLAALGDREAAASAWYLAWSRAHELGDPGANAIALMLSAALPDFEAVEGSLGPSAERVAQHEEKLGALLKQHESRLKDAGEELFGPLVDEG